MPDTLSELAPPRPCASWLLQRLPGMVVEHQRDEVAQTLAAAPTIVVEITPAVGVRILSGDRLLLDIPTELAAQRVRKRRPLVTGGLKGNGPPRRAE